MSSITLTASMRTNLASLKTIAAQMNKTQNILSTGKKVNSAIDNASSYYQARALTNRANDLNALLDTMGQGIQTIQAATEGLTSATTFLEQATAVANQALASDFGVVNSDINNDKTNEAEQQPQTYSLRQTQPDYSGYSQVRTAEELQMALNDENVDKILIMESLNFVSTKEQNVGFVLNNNKTIEGYGENITLTFDHSAFLEGVKEDYGENTLEYLAITAASSFQAEDGAILKNINIKSDCSAIAATGNFYLDNVNIDAALIGIAIGSETGNNHTLSGNANIKAGVGIGSYGCSTIDGDFNIHATTYSFGDYSDSQGLSITGEKNIISGNINVVGGQSYFENTTFTEASRINLANIEEIGGNIELQFNDCSIKSGAEFNLGFVGDDEMQQYIVIADEEIGSLSGKEEVENFFSPYKTNNSQLQQSFVDSVIQAFENNSSGGAGGGGAGGTTGGGTGGSGDAGGGGGTGAGATGDVGQFNSILSEFDKLINDSSYQGVNLLKGANLTVTFNESRSNKFTVSGRDMSAESLRLTTRDWTNKADVETSIKELTSAIDEIREFQTELGNNYSIIQTRQNFTEALTDVLEAGADNLVLADMNEESANYLALQTRQQLATNSLSLAAQSAQSVLSLF